jgi:TRAP transporter TAXI family solute receptor
VYDRDREADPVTRVVGSLVGVVLVAGLAAAQGAGHRPRTELLVMTGSEDGTYYAVARDLERLTEEVAPELGVDLDVVPSQGALQNAIEVFRHDGIHLGITQLDVVSYLTVYGKGNVEARRIIEGLQLVLPLYDEEVHLLVRRGIHGIAGLRGQRVAVGEPGSGTTVTALTLLHLAGVKPRGLEALGVAEALAAMRKGDIDALFHVVGAPAPLLLEHVAAADQFVLVPIRLDPRSEDAQLATTYTPATIAARTYPWQDRPVETVAVKSAIVTTGSTRCEAIGVFARLAVDRLDWLRQNGHPKWRSVVLEPARLLAHPRLSPCVAKHLRP